jgi:hypothetical protein
VRTDRRTGACGVADSELSKRCSEPGPEARAARFRVALKFRVRFGSLSSKSQSAWGPWTVTVTVAVAGQAGDS